MNRFWLCVLWTGCLTAGLANVASAENWPNWRGPRGDGTSLEKQLPLTWSETENIAWKAPIKFNGHSSPIIFDDHIILVGADLEARTRTLSLLDRKTGVTKWDRVVVTAPLEKIHKLNSYASSTPATDGKRIYISFLDQKEMVIAAYDFAGEELWKVRPGIFSSTHGYCSSPVIYKDKLIINGDHDGDSYIVSLEQTTGKTVWKTMREFRTRSYCTPIIREIDGKMQMMLSGSKCIASYDPDTGEKLWIVDGPTEQFVASPVYHQNMLFITGGFPDKHILAVNPAGKGNITKTNIVWHHLRSGVSYVPSPIAVGNYFFVAADNGIGTCFDTKTGTIHWQERLGRHYSGSLIASGDGLVYFVDDDGLTHVVKPGEKLEVVATNKLHDACYSSPAISQGQIFIRCEKHLFCIGKPASGEAGK